MVLSCGGEGSEGEGRGLGGEGEGVDAESSPAGIRPMGGERQQRRDRRRRRWWWWRRRCGEGWLRQWRQLSAGLVALQSESTGGLFWQKPPVLCYTVRVADSQVREHPYNSNSNISKSSALQLASCPIQV